ncbi:hypothetical protein CHS0354_041218 [Potamilus streckersoni]|uniref:Uncharacterized protein n=1 Tax=Potamilus streckersoni TaxID=2493646 RepID=A0AAE0SEF3_9BIVA|nr:hypothetical protein CHS0354_041218 [Potamilus streckersoni]
MHLHCSSNKTRRMVEVINLWTTIMFLALIFQNHRSCKTGDQDKRWVPHMCYNTCAANARQWFSVQSNSMTFAVPMIWMWPNYHISNCCSRMVPSARKRVKEEK